jgi:hypothetical protein
MSVPRGPAVLVAGLLAAAALAAAPAEARKLRPLSDRVVVESFALQDAILTAGLDPAETDRMLDRLALARAAGERGLFKNALHALGGVNATLLDLGAPPPVQELGLTVQAMVLFESLVGPIPDVPTMVLDRGRRGARRRAPRDRRM